MLVSQCFLIVGSGLALGSLWIWKPLSLNPVSEAALPSFKIFCFHKALLHWAQNIQHFRWHTNAQSKQWKAATKNFISSLCACLRLAWKTIFLPCFLTWGKKLLLAHLGFFILWNKDEDAEHFHKALSELQIKKKKVIGRWFFFSYRTCYSVCQAVKQA